MKFRKYMSVKKTYREQGLIYFTCVNYDKQPDEIKEKIRRLCRECGGEYERALFEMVTRENLSISWLERTYHVSGQVLYERRRRFYEKW